MTQQPTEIDPTHLPVEFENAVDPDDRTVTVAPDQTPEPDTTEEG
jgi:hypothetical protein